MKKTSNASESYLESCRDEFWQKVFRLETDYLIKHLKGCRDVLSIGCGPAIIESGLSQHGFHVTGLDISQDALHCAPDSVRTVTARAEDMSFPQNSFDAVIYVASLQFIDGYQQALGRSVSILRPNGKIILMLLNPASVYFQKRFHDPDSYVSKTKHTDLQAIEDTLAESFTVHPEYFLDIKGREVSETATVKTDAALYILLGTKRSQLSGSGICRN
ncbi:class I SAM-dependent methyltransferase [candidate division KSB1 bacterium]|nr:MAG: class I SAM-dependent methyltransferase [candidate division KSB1 bacterium]